MYFRLLTALTASALVAVNAASAAPLPKGGMTLQEVATWLHGKKCETEINDKNNFVACKADGQVYAVFTSDCTNGRCLSLQYYYGLTFKGGVKPDDPAAYAYANAWNSNCRWVKATITSSRDVELEMDQLLAPEGTTGILDQSLAKFLDGVAIFRDNINNGKTPGPGVC